MSDGIIDMMIEYENQLKPCPKCGNKGEFKHTCGGPCCYVAVHCTNCDMNSRGMGNILPQLYSTDSPDCPQRSIPEAIEKWNKL